DTVFKSIQHRELTSLGSREMNSSSASSFSGPVQMCITMNQHLFKTISTKTDQYNLHGDGIYCRGAFVLAMYT
uniref:Uncharacterized protein n=1 Tax=Haplochromis burtoni TaxID=8153 RepID=A0A3Q2VA45_HAPBU